MDELYIRLDLAERKISQIKHKIARRDLLKMVKTIDTAMVAADMESVECRRLHKETTRYRELVLTAHTLVDNLEKHLTFAALLSG
jgi:hypothetical protein